MVYAINVVPVKEEYIFTSARISAYAAIIINFDISVIIVIIGPYIIKHIDKVRANHGPGYYVPLRS